MPYRPTNRALVAQGLSTDLEVTCVIHWWDQGALGNGHYGWGPDGWGWQGEKWYDFWLFYWKGASLHRVRVRQEADSKTVTVHEDDVVETLSDSVDEVVAHVTHGRFQGSVGWRWCVRAGSRWCWVDSSNQKRWIDSEILTDYFISYRAWQLEQELEFNAKVATMITPIPVTHVELLDVLAYVPDQYAYVAVRLDYAEIPSQYRIYRIWPDLSLAGYGHPPREQVIPSGVYGTFASRSVYFRQQYTAGQGVPSAYMPYQEHGRDGDFEVYLPAAMGYFESGGSGRHLSDGMIAVRVTPYLEGSSEAKLVSWRVVDRGSGPIGYLGPHWLVSPTPSGTYQDEYIWGSWVTTEANPQVYVADTWGEMLNMGFSLDEDFHYQFSGATADQSPELLFVGGGTDGTWWDWSDWLGYVYDQRPPSQYVNRVVYDAAWPYGWNWDRWWVRSEWVGEWEGSGDAPWGGSSNTLAVGVDQLQEGLAGDTKLYSAPSPLNGDWDMVPATTYETAFRASEVAGAIKDGNLWIRLWFWENELPDTSRVKVWDGNNWVSPQVFTGDGFTSFAVWAGSEWIS